MALPQCRTGIQGLTGEPAVRSPPEQRDLWEKEPEWLCTWPAIFQPLLEHFPCLKKCTTLPGKLFHCWTPPPTKKRWSQDLSQKVLPPLYLFIIEQQQNLPLPFLLSTQDPLLLLVACCCCCCCFQVSSC